MRETAVESHPSKNEGWGTRRSEFMGSPGAKPRRCQERSQTARFFCYYAIP